MFIVDRGTFVLPVDTLCHVSVYAVKSSIATKVFKCCEAQGNEVERWISEVHGLYT